MWVGYYTRLVVVLLCGIIIVLSPVYAYSIQSIESLEQDTIISKNCTEHSNSDNTKIESCQTGKINMNNGEYKEGQEESRTITTASTSIAVISGFLSGIFTGLSLVEEGTNSVISFTAESIILYGKLAKGFYVIASIGTIISLAMSLTASSMDGDPYDPNSYPKKCIE